MFFVIVGGLEDAVAGAEGLAEAFEAGLSFVWVEGGL